MRYEFGSFALDTEARQLSTGGQAAHLSGKAFDLLRFLVEQRPRAVNKRELHDRLWPDTFVVEASLPVLIAEIRTALGRERQMIRTVHRFGYAFAADVREAGQEGPAESGPLHLLVHPQREFRLVQGDNIVGRDPQAGVLIPSASVSRRHAVVTVEGSRAFVTDLQSKNGTRIDGATVTTSVPLRSGCVISFGTTDVVYRLTLPNADTDTVNS